jgi:hypothetical protein
MIKKYTNLNHYKIRRDLRAQHYPKISSYNAICRMRRSIYTTHGVDLRDTIWIYIDRDEVMSYYHSIQANPEHLVLLSTSGMNFLTYIYMVLDIDLPQISTILSIVQNIS